MGSPGGICRALERGARMSAYIVEIEQDKLTPLRAVRIFCGQCVGGYQHVQNCGGNKMLGGQGDKNGVCYFWPYRLGKGRVSVKTIRKFCLECMGNSSRSVEDCSTLNCPVWIYRLGKNPRFAGRTPPTAGKISQFKRSASG